MIAPTELRRFTERHGARAVVDEDSRAYKDAGLGFIRFDDAELIERLLADQRLIKLPLVRSGNSVSVGVAEKAWREMLSSDR